MLLLFLFLFSLCVCVGMYVCVCAGKIVSAAPAIDSHLLLCLLAVAQLCC